MAYVSLLMKCNCRARDVAGWQNKRPSENHTPGPLSKAAVMRQGVHEGRRAPGLPSRGLLCPEVAGPRARVCCSLKINALARRQMASANVLLHED